MNGPGRKKDSCRSSLLIPAAFVSLAALTGFLPVRLLFGVEFMTAGIFAFAGTALFGPGWGIAAAVLGSFPTYLYWSHPYGMLIITAEAAFTAWLTHRRRLDLTLSVLAFWLLPGILLLGFIYKEILRVPHASVLFVMFRFAVNGLWNAAFAAILIPWLQQHLGRLPARWYAGPEGTRRKTPMLTLTQLVSNLMILLLASGMLVQMTFTSIRHMNDIEGDVADKLKNAMNQLQASVRSADGRPDMDDLAVFSQGQPDFTVYISDLVQPGTVLRGDGQQLGAPLYMSALTTHGTLRELVDGVQIWSPAQGSTSRIQQHLQSAYIFTADWKNSSRYRITLSHSAAPYWNQIYKELYESLALVYLLTGLAVIGIFPISRRLTRKLVMLSEQSGQFASRMGTGYRPAWPKSRFREIHTLSESLSLMAEELNRQFDDMSNRQKQLARHAADTSEELAREKEQIELQRNITQSILEATREGMLLCGLDGRILFANRRLRDFFGVCGAEAGSIDGLFCNVPGLEPESAKLLLEEIHAFLRQNSKEFSFRRNFSYKMGQEVFHYSLYAAPTMERAGLEDAKLLVFRDRTEEEQEDALKEDMANQISHELRTPLTSILGFTEIMNNKELSPERRKQYTATIYNEAVRLSRLVDDFLDLQRMEAGHQRYFCVPLDMRELVAVAAANWSPENQRRLLLELPDQPALLMADADRIKQVLHNLISNAIKYSPEASPITVSVRQDNGMVYVDVADHGLGIPEGDKDKIFRKFYRVEHADRRKISGSGLGLAIVKEIVEAHNGEITFRSDHGKGSVFSLWMPAYRLPDTEGKVLLISWDEEYGKELAAALENHSVPALPLRSFEEALFAVRSGVGAPRAITADLLGAGLMNGLEFAAELHRSPAGSVPVCFLEAMELGGGSVQSREYTRFRSRSCSAEALIRFISPSASGPGSGLRCRFPMQDSVLLQTQLAKYGLVPDRMVQDGESLIVFFS